MTWDLHLAEPFRVLVRQLPLACLAAALAGAGWTCWRLVERLRTGRGGWGRELMPLLLAAVPLGVGAAQEGRLGVWAVLASLPALALLAARALLACAGELWPERRCSAAAALAALALAPGLRAALRAVPWGLAAWSEWAGGAPGAASSGLPRLLAGDPASGLLGSLSAHAVPGARVWWGATPRAAVEAWQRGGRLRADLAWAEAPAEADVAVWRCRESDRDLEYQVWTAFRSARPVDGAFLDEVPLALVYARPGAWR